jgi:hypothetical protein
MAITSGTRVKSGYYFNSKRWAFARVENDGEALPGVKSDRWTRVPVPLMFAAAPVLGGVFVVAFPLIGAVAVGIAIGRKLGGGVKETAAELAANLGPMPLPGEAHLTGKPGEKAEGAASTPPELEKLGKDIEEKRRK